MDWCSVREMFFFIIAACFSLRKIIQREKIEKSIIFYSIPCGPAGLILKKVFKIPYLISLRGGDVPRHVKSLNLIHSFLAPLRRTILRNADHVVANSESFAELSRRTDPVKVQVIPNGVDTLFFTPQETTGEIFRLVYAGRFQKEKNISFLIECIRADKDTYAKRITLHLVGDGPLRKQILEKIEEYRLHDMVVCEGWLDKNQLRDLYRRCNCVVNPSFGEGMPNTVLEGMACGLPSLLSRVRGNDAVIIEGKTGYSFGLDDSAEFNMYLKKMMNSRGKTLAMGRYARQWVESAFSWHNSARMYIDLM